MRRSIQALGRRLGSISAAGSLAGAPGGSAGLLGAAVDGVLAAGGVHAARPAAAAAAAAWPRSLSYHDGDGGSHQRRPHRRGPPQVDPDSDLGHLLACESVAEMRAWREGLEAEGRFDAAQLSLAIRRLGQAGELDAEERNAFMLELLEGVARGSLPLDGKSAVYLLWMPAKCGWQGDDAALQAVLPCVYGQLEGMQTNDVSTLLWALARLGIPPHEEVCEQLYDKLLEMLPQMNLKELTATAFGVAKLRMPHEVLAALVPALEAKVPDRLHRDQAERLLKLVAFMPGVLPESLLAQRVFTSTAFHAKRLGLYALAEAAWAATRVGYHYEERDMKRILDAAQYKLQENKGSEVQTLLAAVSHMGFRAGDGLLTHELVDACVESQVEVLCSGSQRPNAAAHLSKFLVTLSVLRAHVPQDVLARSLEFLQGAGLESLPKPWQLQMAFRRLGYQPGVEALEPLTGHEAAWKEKQAARQALEAAEAGQAEEQEGGAAEQPAAAAAEAEAEAAAR